MFQGQSSGGYELWLIGSLGPVAQVRKVDDGIPTVQRAVELAEASGPGDYHVVNHTGRVFRKVLVGAPRKTKRKRRTLALA